MEDDRRLIDTERDRISRVREPYRVNAQEGYKYIPIEATPSNHDFTAIVRILSLEFGYQLEFYQTTITSGGVVYSGVMGRR